jgi:hypothetical protein
MRPRPFILAGSAPAGGQEDLGPKSLVGPPPTLLCRSPPACPHPPNVIPGMTPPHTHTCPLSASPTHSSPPPPPPQILGASAGGHIRCERTFADLPALKQVYFLCSTPSGEPVAGRGPVVLIIRRSPSSWWKVVGRLGAGGMRLNSDCGREDSGGWLPAGVRGSAVQGRPIDRLHCPADRQYIWNVAAAVKRFDREYEERRAAAASAAAKNAPAAQGHGAGGQPSARPGSGGRRPGSRGVQR